MEKEDNKETDGKERRRWGAEDVEGHEGQREGERKTGRRGGWKEEEEDEEEEEDGGVRGKGSRGGGGG